MQLLEDLRAVFTSSGEDNISTDDILTALVEMTESPWSDLRGKPLDARGLARRLAAYGIKSKNVRIGERVVKGYVREDLHDPWVRYLVDPPLDSATSATSATDPPPPPVRCAACGDELDRALSRMGDTTHPSCEFLVGVA